MKKLGFFFFSGLTAALLFTGCGGGSSSSSSSTLATYDGAASVGDFASYSISSDGNTYTLSYNISGNVFGNKSGSRTLTNVYNKVFFRDDQGNYYFVSGSLGAAQIPMDNGNVAYIIGLNLPTHNLTATDLQQIVNKRFNLAFFNTDNTIGWGILDINSSNINDLNGTWTLYDSTGTTTGTWDVNGSHIDAFNSTGKVYNVVIKPGTNRAGIIVDRLNGGFAVGMEARPLTTSEFSNATTFSYFYKDGSGNNEVDCYGTVTVDLNTTSNNVEFRYQDTWCSDNQPQSSSGTLILNPTIGGVTFNGIAQIQGTNDYIYVDPEDGYYLRINTNDATLLGVGSNKPLQ